MPRRFWERPPADRHVRGRFQIGLEATALRLQGVQLAASESSSRRKHLNVLEASKTIIRSQRHSLKSSSIEQLLCVKEWYQKCEEMIDASTLSSNQVNDNAHSSNNKDNKYNNNDKDDDNDTEDNNN
ncbi:hypothetical protein PGT21_019219 [Puccinia graminis f. sp. tritici]|uniref:HAT C-terminal dimerisation domain-containing protein n=1 Tax=Puccinia graminis f. sp. tritici TaxID=56615 RepID=A0A5B0LJ83_PUCGR|nr:hypothetical protein PGT21_019219 [Puccinia graminis f. sp. tritici]